MTTFEIIIVCWLAFITGGLFAICRYVVKKTTPVIDIRKDVNALGFAVVLLIESVKKNNSGPLN